MEGVGGAIRPHVFGMGKPHTPTRHSTDDDRAIATPIVASDGVALAAIRYEPDSAPVGAVIIHGATAVPQRHYATFARHVAARGYRVLTYDYRGVGASAPDDLRRCDATMSQWITEDAPAAVRALSSLDPALPLFAIGHSFGGQIAAGLAGVPAPRAIVTAGAQRGYWATFPEWQRWWMALRLFALLPAVATTFGYVPGPLGLGEDMPRGVLLEWARWCRAPHYLYGDHADVAARLASYAGDVLTLSVTDDDFAPHANVEWLLDRYEQANIEHMRFDPSDVGAAQFGHFGFFRNKVGGALWPSIVSFFDRQRGAAGDPSARRGNARPNKPSREARGRALADEIQRDLDYGRASQ